MKKNVLLFLCFGFFLCSAVVPKVALAGHQGDKEDPKLEALIKEKSKYVSKLYDLLIKYEEVTGKEKKKIKKDIKKLVKTSLDKNVAFKQAIIDKNKKVIEKLEKELADIKADKNKYIDDKVDFYVSPEGLSKMHAKATGPCQCRGCYCNMKDKEHK
ncbi:MAG: hypothetical protein LBI80_04110 [Endomicrobium sp.]|jgi:hypothetical protein|nr:hypothetical protein [Endomicrobium sp.]